MIFCRYEWFSSPDCALRWMSEFFMYSEGRDAFELKDQVSVLRDVHPPVNESHSQARMRGEDLS